MVSCNPNGSTEVRGEAVRDAEVDVLRRLREEESPLLKGLGRVELGSEERARSCDSGDLESWSIWLVHMYMGVE